MLQVVLQNCCSSISSSIFSAPLQLGFGKQSFKRRHDSRARFKTGTQGTDRRNRPNKNNTHAHADIAASGDPKKLELCDVQIKTKLSFWDKRYLSSSILYVFAFDN
jgi:hypothetical protein